MKTIWLICAGLLITVGLGLAPALSQDMGGDEGGNEADGMEDWKKLQEPGDAHGLLAKMIGDWDMNFKMWMAPGADPVEMQMATTFESEYGGRFIVGEYEMTEGPFPHTGETWFGHDNAKGKYQWIRVTDMDTSMRVYEGDYDEKTKTITTRSSYSMEWGGETHEVNERNVWTFVSDDKITMEVWTVYVGMPGMPEEGVKEVEITYTRAKEAAPMTQDPHGILKKLEGDFAFDMSIWMGPEPIEMSGEMEYEWTLDGQSIVMEYDATDMESMPHKGIEYISYNEGSGEYESIRMTSMSGALVVWKGKYDAESKTIEFTAPFSGEFEGEKISGTSRAVYKWESDDKYTVVMYSKYDGMDEEVKEMEMTLTRK